MTFTCTSSVSCYNIQQAVVFASITLMCDVVIYTPEEAHHPLLQLQSLPEFRSSFAERRRYPNTMCGMHVKWGPPSSSNLRILSLRYYVDLFEITFCIKSFDVGNNNPTACSRAMYVSLCSDMVEMTGRTLDYPIL